MGANLWQIYLYSCRETYQVIRAIADTQGMACIFPVKSEERLFEQADIIWFAGSESDWRQAFAQQPKIGDIDSLWEKSASGMIEILQTRLLNSPEDELQIAMQEQNKTTKIRLQKLIVA